MAEQMRVRWRTVHRLAAELALNRVSKNLVQDVVTYLRAYPETPLLDYAARLKQLSEGGYFQAGKSGPYERVDLHNALKRVSVPDEADPALQLSWVARLIEYYTQVKLRAAHISDLSLPEPRRGEHLDGMVREMSRSTMWVRVASGQWGRARRSRDVDVGDEVEVEVTRVRSPVDFDVNFVRVIRRATPVTPTVPESEPEPLLIDVSEERDKEISEAADDFMAFLRQQWDKEGEDG